MTGITSEQIERYLGNLQPGRDALMRRMEAYAQQHDVPIIGPVAGRFLYTIAKIHRSRSILEAGTAIGYTALWFARATADWGGGITTLEAHPEMAEEARKNLTEAGVIDRVHIVMGDALEALSQVKGTFDLCFIDHEKEQYFPFLERALPKIKSGGVILADNVLRRGQVANEGGGDPTVRAMREFNRFVMDHPELETVIVPLRDGISLSVKKAR